MINKELVRKRFSKKLAEYNKNAKIQIQMAEKLCSFLDKNCEYDDILEIGCGTGFLTKLISKEIKFSCYTAIDIVSGCKEYIEEINPKIDFCCDDAENFINNSNKKYDLIISNAVFQWIEDFESFIRLLTNLLKPDGVLLFSTFGKENFKEIYSVLGKTLKYYSVDELKSIFAEYNSEIKEEIRIMSFKNPTDVLKHLQLTGVNALESNVWTKKNLIEFENGYNNLCTNRTTLTYHPIYAVIKNF